MVVKILKTEPSSEGAITYNEKKVIMGNARLVSTRNIESNTLLDILDTFHRYEENPAISERARNCSFHMTVCPNKGEYMSQEKTVEFIERIMKELGYEKQPYVIYQHNDIEREHYHVVSTRFDERGKKIGDYNNARTINKLLKSLSKEYGFVVGSGERGVKSIPVNRQKVPRFRAGSANVVRSLEALFRRALKYVFHSFSQLQIIMKSMDVRVETRKNKKGTYSVVMKGLDRTGHAATKYYSASKDLGIDGWSMIEERIKESEKAYRWKVQDKQAVLMKSDYCEKRSGSSAEYKDLMEQLGVWAEISRTPATGKIERVTLVEPESETIVDTAANELALADFVRKEEEGYWGRRSRKERQVIPESEKEAVISRIDMSVGRVPLSERTDNEMKADMDNSENEGISIG